VQLEPIQSAKSVVVVRNFIMSLKARVDGVDESNK
jgi:hypothetical protein